ncbi:MAG: glycosyltransferase [Chloroflexi bacterium]|nr:glycosyltransferase [Chloroflexota bacterium]
MGKRIALISEHASPLAALGGVDSGGQNVYVAQLAKHLAAVNYHVDVLTRRDNGSLDEIVEWQDGIRVIHIKAGPPTFVRKEELMPFMEEFATNAINLIRRDGDYDLIHANFWMSGMVAAQIKQLLGTPFVITFHALGKVRRIYQGRADDFPEARFAIEEELVKQADQIIAESPQDEEDLIRFYNADPGKITMIPCGFDPTEFSPVDKHAAREMLGWKPDEFIVLQLGRMVPRKGIDNVIRAVARVIKTQGLPERLVLVGGDSDEPDPKHTPEIGRLQHIVQEEGIASYVEFAGRKKRDLLKYIYSAADVFVTTPWYEPFGMTPLEAMACGTPVIGSNVGGIKYSVRDGESGFLVPPKDAEVLAERLAYLQRHPKHLEILGRRAIIRASDKFTWRKITHRMMQLYQQVLGESENNLRTIQAEHVSVLHDFHDAMETVGRSYDELRDEIVQAADLLVNCFSIGGKVLVCGNGGSAAQAQHFAAELVGRFKPIKRRALPMLALNSDGAFITAWANDVAYDDIFARQVHAFGKPGDVLIGLSTSGRSKNVVRAFEQARKQEMYCIGLLGGDGGDLRALSDFALIVPSTITTHIQETHLIVIHILCDLIEQRMAASLQATPNLLDLPAAALTDENPQPATVSKAVKIFVRENSRS